MKPFQAGILIWVLGSSVTIAAEGPIPPGVHSTMPWLKPWEKPKDSEGDAPCTCDDLRARLDEAERMRDAYARAYRGNRLRFNSDLTAYIEKEMGWNEGSAKPQAKPEDATTSQEERKQARANCKYCAWICDVSMQKVHEGYHTWFKNQYEDFVYTGTILGDLLYITQKNFVRTKELSEVGAHQAEATFLRETLSEMERRGLCEGLQGTPSLAEKEDRWKQADEEVRFHLGLPMFGNPIKLEAALP